MVFERKRIVWIFFCTLMVAAGGYLLAFGTLISCCSVVRPGESFWQLEKLFYGILPICASIAIFVFASRFWGRLYIRRWTAWLAGFVLFVFVLVLEITVFLKYRGSLDDEIYLVWQGESGVFSWGSGEVRLPAGFSYKADRGHDTFVGQFTSQDGRLVIRHDIGELAGEHGGMGKSETLIQGSRVRVGRLVFLDGRGRTKIFSKVSFPDNGCANFDLESSDEKDEAAIEFIAKGFRPKGWKPSWVKPVLPEILRSDCRYRFQFPDVF